MSWAAGFWDGEGSVGHYKSKCGNHVQYSLHASIGQKDREVLDKFRAAVGVGRVYHSGGIYRYQATTFEDVQYIACVLWNDLGSIKREQFKKALEEYHAAPVTRRYHGHRT